ncbi:methyltransferase domain-containing protein, partial [Undibacterium sp.]|uniref:methyltransferase domain-containing protein n=1 Tax=Undibacterium sp. TaxID=1914977 RepID=UPI003750BEF8
MAEKLDLIKIDCKYALDLGCGSGSDLQSLVKRFPDASTVVGIDGSWQTLKQANQDERAPESRLDSFLTRFLSVGSKRQSQ